MQKLKYILSFLPRAWKILEGKKTEICAGLGALVAAARFLGYVTDDTAIILYGLLGFGAASALGARVRRLQSKG